MNKCDYNYYMLDNNLKQEINKSYEKLIDDYKIDILANKIVDIGDIEIES